MNDPRTGLPRFLEALAKGISAEGLVLDGIQATFRPPSADSPGWTVCLRAETGGRIASTQWKPPQEFALELWPEALAEGLVTTLKRMTAPAEPERKVLQ